MKKIISLVTLCAVLLSACKTEYPDRKTSATTPEITETETVDTSAVESVGATDNNTTEAVTTSAVSSPETCENIQPFSALPMSCSQLPLHFPRLATIMVSTTKGGHRMHPWRHFCTITRHRWLVRRGCFRVGLYWQGLTHDLSKYSPTEFLTGARLYQGNRSPNAAEREHTSELQSHA